MSAAEIDLRRRALGLSAPETAVVLGVAVRTVGYWLAGDGEPRDPDTLLARLVEVEVTMGDIVEDIASQADEQESAVVTLVRYRTQAELDASGLGRGLPIGAHAMALAWALEEMQSDGHQVRVQWATA